MKHIIPVASLPLTLWAATAAIANDSTAAVGLGGIELTRNDAISMDSEDLYISRDLVTVKYRFTNNSAKDVETLVSFPLPPLPPAEYFGDQSYPDWSTELDFKTFVDGQLRKLDVREIATVIGDAQDKDITGRLKSLGWPVKYWIDYTFEEGLQQLTDAKKTALIREGLLRRDEEDDQYVRPNWQVKTHVTRKQIFPAGKTIAVEHSYKPVAGGSVAGLLMPEYRTGAGDALAEHKGRYCIDSAFLKGFDKRYYAERKKAKARGEDYGGNYSEIWIDYALKSGANWKGPIKDFRLVVDKGKADNLVSFCMTGVKKIGPTRFEVRKSNFEPARDLNILIVEFAQP